jgi:uncharacterized protein (TIGR03546 family)
VLVFVAIFLFRVQIGAATISAGLFAFVSWIFDPLFNALGQRVLGAEALAPLFTSLYNVPLVPLTRFNNTVVMGAGVLTVFLAPLVFFASRRLIAVYREQIVARFQNTKTYKAWTMTSLFKWYAKYDELFG